MTVVRPGGSYGSSSSSTHQTSDPGAGGTAALLGFVGGVVALFYFLPAVAMAGIAAIMIFGVVASLPIFRGRERIAMAAGFTAVAAAGALYFLPGGGDVARGFAVGAMAFVLSVFLSIGSVWSTVAAIADVASASPLTGPIVAGILTGAVMALVHRSRLLKIGRRGQESVVSAAMAGKQAFIVNLIVAYVVALLLDWLGVFGTGGAATIDVARQMQDILAAGGAGGAGGGGGGQPPVFSLLVTLLALLGALIGFGGLIGLLAGLPAGAIAGLLPLHKAVEGAAGAATLHALDGESRLPRRLVASTARGAVEGTITGAVVSAALGMLHLATLL
jgi:hypothetical protein